MAVRKALAYWLVLLALSPVTAPFSTCDLSTLESSGVTEFAHAAKLSPASETLAAAFLAPSNSPESPAAGRTKFLVHAYVAAIPLVAVDAKLIAGGRHGSSSLPAHTGSFSRLRI